jgi:hypothetical protein
MAANPAPIPAKTIYIKLISYLLIVNCQLLIIN